MIYTPPPTSMVLAVVPPNTAEISAPLSRRPFMGQRPLRRRRPQYEYYDENYYDDYYDERLRSNRGRKRPRPRPRPIYYDDEYDDVYDDDRYEWRGVRRRPYDKKGGRRKNSDRSKDNYDEEHERSDEDDYRSSKNVNK